MSSLGISDKNGRTYIGYVEQVAKQNPMVDRMLRDGIKQGQGTVDICQDIIMALHNENIKHRKFIKEILRRVEELRRGMLELRKRMPK